MTGRSRRGKRILARRIARDSILLALILASIAVAIYATMMALNTPLHVRL